MAAWAAAETRPHRLILKTLAPRTRNYYRSQDQASTTEQREEGVLHHPFATDMVSLRCRDSADIPDSSDDQKAGATAPAVLQRKTMRHDRGRGVHGMHRERFTTTASHFTKHSYGMEQSMRPAALPPSCLPGSTWGRRSVARHMQQEY